MLYFIAIGRLEAQRILTKNKAMTVINEIFTKHSENINSYKDKFIQYEVNYK